MLARLIFFYFQGSSIAPTIADAYLQEFMVVDAQDRWFAVPAETRFVTVPAEGRLVQV